MTPPELITHVEIAIEKALRGDSRLDADTLAIGGFSTGWIRRLFNNLCAPPVKTFLEVGTFLGGTACASVCGNHHLRAFTIEDFSQPFGEDGVRDKLLKSIETVRPKGGELNLIEGDCWRIDRSEIPPVDFFSFDGEHGAESQSRALPHFFDQMNDSFIFEVDDWNWPQVVEGTWRGFDKLAGRLIIDKQWVFTTGRQDDPQFWNGVFICVCTKI